MIGNSKYNIKMPQKMKLRIWIKRVAVYLLTMLFCFYTQEQYAITNTGIDVGASKAVDYLVVV